MTRAMRTCAASAMAFVAAALGASAQMPPVAIDMKGTWKLTAESIMEGSTPNGPAQHESKPAGKYRLLTQEIVYRFEGQEGRRFWGTVNSSYARDGRQIGSVSPDGKSIYMIGDRSMTDGTITSPDTIEMCARHIGPNSGFVACGVMRRQK